MENKDRVTRLRKEMGERIKKLRKEKGLSGSKLASLVGITQPYFSEIERGLKTPSTECLRQIALILETSIAFLLGEQNFPNLGYMDQAMTIAGQKEGSLLILEQQAKEGVLFLFDKLVAIDPELLVVLKDFQKQQNITPKDLQIISQVFKGVVKVVLENAEVSE